MKNETAGKRVVQYYTNHVLRYRKYAFGIIFTMPFASLTNNYIPNLIIASILNRLSLHHYSHNVFKSFGPSVLLYFGLILLGIVIYRILDRLTYFLEANIEQDMAEEVFAHMLSETSDFHANHFSGSLVSQNSKLLGGYIRMADTTIFQTLPLFLGIIFTSIILAPRSPIYTGLLIIFSLIFIAYAVKASRKVRTISAKHAGDESAQTGYLADAITNVLAIKSFARGKYERKRFHEATDTTQSSLREFMIAQGKLFNSLGLISRSISALALFMAIVSVVVFKTSLGTVFLIVSYTGSLVDQLFTFSNSSLRNYSRAIGDSADMVDVLDHKPEVQDPKSPMKSNIHKGEINFHNVTFTHAQADDSIFTDFNLKVESGQKVGLVGRSGSGKSTLIKLIMRYSDIDSGEVKVDGQNIASITQDDLHRNIAYVPQEPLLFHRTISENIAYGQEDAKTKDIERAAHQANAAEFIDTLPNKYETLVGERGVKLSGGQRQRVAIARALLKNAPILVLDEATSSLDSESEVLIQEALWKLMENKTAIVIAHRLSTIQKMDRIIVLDNGKIVEDGKHAELIKADGIYAKLWAHQSGGFIEDEE